MIIITSITGWKKEKEREFFDRLYHSKICLLLRHSLKDAIDF